MQQIEVQNRLKNANTISRNAEKTRNYSKAE